MGTAARASARVLVMVALAGGLPPVPSALAQTAARPCGSGGCTDAGSAGLAQPAGGAPAGGMSPSGGAAASGRFDFYVLALSWSPGFCATGGGSKARAQCAAGSGLGFVVHGLWPQNAHGFPSDCGAAGRSPSRQSLETVRGVYPDEGLARYEWRKHGTCTGRSPTDYFADVRRARDRVVIPPGFQTPHEDQTWVPLDVARAFAAANPGLRTDEMAVTCRGGTLEEVRICLAKDLRGYVPCPEVARASCRGGGMDVPPER